MTNKAPRMPVPEFLSEQAQASLARIRPEAAYPDKDDTQGWLTLVSQIDSWIESAFSGIELPVRVDETEIAGVHTYVVRGPRVEDSPATPVYLDIHGGALMFGGGRSAHLTASPLALGTNMIHWVVDYRMPPLHPYPAALDDVFAVYNALLEVRDPADIIVGGGSAGGNLAAALLLRAQDEGLAMPAALVLNSPEIDLTESGDTFNTLDAVSPALGSLMKVNRLYAGGADLTHPYLSPLFGDVSGFPPTLLISGTRDLYLSNTVRMHRKLRAAGVAAELHVFEAMPHGGFGGAPEDQEVNAEMIKFITRHRQA